VLSHHFGAVWRAEHIYFSKLLKEDCFLPKEKCQTNVPMMSYPIDSKDANHPEAGRIISLPQKDETPLDSKPSFSIPEALREEMDALGGTAAWGGSEDNDLQPDSGEEITAPESFHIEYRGFTEADFGTGPSELRRLRRFRSLAKEVVENLATLLIGSVMDGLLVKMATIILSTKWWRWMLLLFSLIWPPT
jgi:hypothetical protein